MMRSERLEKVVIILFIVAALILVHQYVVYGVWFEPDQVLHHETFALILIAFALGLAYAIKEMD